jgi:Rod binding domain-containing protein
MTTSALSAPVDLLKPIVSSPLTGAGGKTKEQIAKTAQDFEASFVSVMLGQMFDGVGENSQFSGGEGEQMFKSFMMDAFSKQMSKAGGIGIAGPVQKEMLKLQGLEG